ncbi:MAG: DUF350 domain-containing protein [Verrucomicrobiales bacterium]|nr:DUF350 domain-containing protein [Verrucomicrobiales bacterium]
MHPVLYNILVLFAYGVAGSIMMAVALGILIKVWDWITPVDEWEELKKGNIAVAIVTAAVILSLAIVIAAAILPGS